MLFRFELIRFDLDLKIPQMRALSDILDKILPFFVYVEAMEVFFNETKSDKVHNLDD